MDTSIGAGEAFFNKMVGIIVLHLEFSNMINPNTNATKIKAPKALKPHIASEMFENLNFLRIV